MVSKLNILLIENNPSDVQKIQRMLTNGRPTPISLDCVDCLSRGLDRLDKGDIDVVLLDLSLPDSCGLDSVIRIHEHAGSLPIIVLTGLDNEQSGRRIVFEGAQDFLIKGEFDSKVLLQALHYAIDRKRVEDSQQASESRFRRVAEHNADAILVVDHEKRVRFANPAAEEMFGKKKEKLLGTRFGYPLRKNKGVEIEIHRPRKKTTVAEIRVADIEWDGSTATLVSLRDVTKRTEIEEAMRTSKEKLKIILENINDTILQVSPEGIIQYVNPKAEKIYGYRPQDLIGQHLEMTTPQSELPKAMNVLKRVSSGRAVKNLEIDQKDSFGNVITMEVNAVPVKRDGKVVAVQGVMRSISERKQAEKALKESIEKLQKLDELKSKFLSTISHELRTPIAIMREGVSLCIDGIAGDISDTQHELLTHSLENIDRLASLISDLLDVSKIESGKYPLRRSSLDIRQIVDEVYDRFLPQAEEKGLVCTKLLPDQPLKLFADYEKITQIFDNLISNAIRFTESGGEIRIQAAENPGCLECSVSDTGVGIDEENIPKLFTKFEQFARVEGPGYRGTGLGLAIVKGLVEEHEGKVWVDSELGKGTTFWFTLKKVPFPTILIIDDEKTIVDVVERMLQADDYQFLKAYDGEHAVTQAQENAVSLIILDMMLPGMSGYEVIGRLKQDVRTCNVPILISTGFDVDEQRLYDVDYEEAIPIIVKPLDADDLRDKVKKLLMKS